MQLDTYKPLVREIPRRELAPHRGCDMQQRCNAVRDGILKTMHCKLEYHGHGSGNRKTPKRPSEEKPGYGGAKKRPKKYPHPRGGKK